MKPLPVKTTMKIETPVQTLFAQLAKEKGMNQSAFMKLILKDYQRAEALRGL